MTQQHPQPQRCIHECVCHSYLDYQSDDLDPCLAKKCEHDTRPHTPAAPATETITYEEVWDIVDQAVDVAKRDEREQVLDAIEKWSDNEVYGVDDEGYDATPVVPYLGLEHLIKSLRGGER